MGSQLQMLRLPHSLPASQGLGPRVTYAATTAAVVVAGGLSLVLYPRLLTSPLAPFIFAVTFAAWLGGLGSSLLATALSIGAVFFLPYPPGTFTASGSRLVVFGITSLAIGVVAESLVRSRRQAMEQASALQEQAMELEMANQELSESIEEAQQSRDVAEAAEQRYRLLFDRNPVPLWVYDLETLGFLAVNDAAMAHYGFSREEFLGMTLRDIRPPEDVPALMASYRTGAPGLAASGIFRHRKRDGTVTRVEIRSHDMRFADRPARLVLATDVTEQLHAREELQANNARLQELVEDRSRAERALKASEEQLRQAQKMEAVGRLAGGVAHDFNNILTTIQSYAEFLAAELGDETPHLADLREIQKEADRAAGLTRQLLAFSRKQVLESQVLDLNAIVTETERMLRRVIGEDIELVTRLDPELGQIEGDAGHFSQVLLNLAVNARDAMPEGGRLLIETDNVQLDEVYADEHRGASPGPHVLLSVSDTGVGMDATTKTHIFEPFFTTKEPGKGTGLAFRWSTASCSSRVAARRTLADHGYTVLEAANGRQALELAASHDGPIDLVLSDMVMPEMRGGELAARLRRARPEARLLMMSGYTEEAASRQAILEAGNAFLEKPFTVRRLLEKVQQALGRA
jgi:two-component system cell cycle sensor histidine kinase/response regulator CckA